MIGGGIIGLELATVYRGARLEDHRRRAARSAAPGNRPGSRQATPETDRRALRSDPSPDRGDLAHAPEERAESSALERRSAGVRPCPGGGRPKAQRGRDRRRGGRSRRGRARVHLRRPPPAHERTLDLRHRRRRRRPDARPQGHARGKDRGRGDRGSPGRRVRPRRDPVGRVHRSRGRVDGPDRDRRSRAGDRVREGHVSVGGVRACARARARRGDDEAPVRAGYAARCSAPASSA